MIRNDISLDCSMSMVIKTKFMTNKGDNYVKCLIHYIPSSNKHNHAISFLKLINSKFEAWRVDVCSTCNILVLTL